MNEFYRLLKQPGHSKADALRKAQLAMIDDSLSARIEEVRGVQRPEGSGSVSFSHPYYWAPFILIGNAL